MSPALVTARCDTDAIKAIAKNCVRGAVRARARHYMRRPMSLESLFPGLGTFHPRRALAVLDSLEEQERATRRRYIGLGGETILINIKAARLWARHARRYARQLEAV